MKRNVFKLIFIAYVALIGNAAYADDANVSNENKASEESTEVVKNTETSSTEAPDNNPPAEKEASKEEKVKLNAGASGRAIGSLLSNKAKPSSSSTNITPESKKRIEELEELIKQQKKLIEIYKNKNK